MDILKKIKILGEAASYDTVCGSPRSTGMGNKSLIDSVSSFIHKSYSENYDCKMLKVLQTNKCLHDCKYCANRCFRQKNLTEFEPEELAGSFMKLYDKGLVNSLFLSSGVYKNPDYSTEKMLDTVNLMRFKHKFYGYIHFKILPGVSKELIKEAGKLCQRLSINIEAPGKQRLSEISSNKDFLIDIKRRQEWIKKVSPRAGQTTQLIVGSSNESDLEILKTVKTELDDYDLKRFYFSAFSPVKGTPLENNSKASIIREKRLYNTEFLLRDYNLNLNEIELILDKNDMLPLIDPKIALAKHSLSRPVDINNASYEELLRVPGIGPRNANLIIFRRRKNKFRKFEDLKGLGFSIRRAKPYIKIDGNWQKKIFSYF